MRIKKYTGATLQEATAQMKKELGPNAIILGTRRVDNNGVMSFLGKESLEITAAIDDQPSDKQREKNPRKQFQPMLETYSHPTKTAEPQSPISEMQNLAQRFSEKRQTNDATTATQTQTGMEITSLLSEMDEVKSTLNSIATHIKYSKMPALPSLLQQAYTTLVENEVEEQLAADIVQTVYAKLDETQLHSTPIIEKEILRTVTSFIKTPKQNSVKSKKPRIVVLVGPTGVGKTTTIAKLAAIKKLKEQQSVGLITADTFRIGAIDQLRTFAGIASIPMEVVYRPTEMANALKKLKNRDIIFIDTVGRSQRAKKELTELRRFIESVDADEIHLVLNTTMSRKIMLDVVEQFGVMKPTRIIFSKADEALSLGNILTICKKTDIPISYVTTGQGVPDDIIVADSLKIAHLIYPGALGHA